MNTPFANPFLGTTALAQAVALCVAGALGTAHAADAPAAQPLRYFDGGAVRTITLDPAWVAEIHAPTAASSQPQAKAAGSAPVASFAAPLVALRPASQPVARGALGVVSPVFREGDSPAGRLMALPGGVLIKVPASWGEAEVSQWASGQNLAKPQRMGSGGNWYLIATRPGLPALELANTLQQAGDVVFASPNWWKQTASR